MLSVSRVTFGDTGYLSNRGIFPQPRQESPWSRRARPSRTVPLCETWDGLIYQASGSSDADQNGKDKWTIDPTANIEPQKPELTDDDFFICRNTTTVFALDQEGVGPQRQNVVAQRH
jgi:hypothetical protein